MFGTAAFARPAGVLLLGPTAVCLASLQPSLASLQPKVASIRPNRLDSGARG